MRKVWNIPKYATVSNLLRSNFEPAKIKNEEQRPTTHMTPEKGIVTGNKPYVKTLCTFIDKAGADINYYIHLIAFF